MVSELQLPEDRAWELLSIHSAALLRLARQLRSVARAGFRLVVLEWNDPRDPTAVIAHLEGLFPGAATLELQAHDPPDFTVLLTRLAALAEAHPFIHVLGLENWHRARPDTFRLLNYRREHIAAICPAAMLLWLIPPDVTRLAKEAPDLWAWRTSVLDFTRDKEQSVEIERGPELTGAERQAREARLEEIEAYLAEPAATDRSIARLHREAGELLKALGRWAPARDHLVAAADLFREAGDVYSAAHAERVCAEIDLDQGRPDAALDRLRDHLLPLFRQIGDARSIALVQGQIADVLEVRGDLDEALRIRREEELPVYERLGDVRSRAVALGKIADVLAARGDLDEALRIRREEELPAYDRLGDVRSRAVCLGKVADVLAARGELDEALRIRREEELPVYERLGDVRERAVTLGKIADVLEARGELDEALRIRREEVLPVFERLGDVRSLSVRRPRDHRPIVFIGSSEEGKQIARALLSNLSKCSEPRIWTQGEFGRGQGILEAVTSAATRADFAVLVMTSKDFVASRGKSNHMPRDYIVFELGLFIGTLGRDRTFMVLEEDSIRKLPSDVAGIAAATFLRLDQLGINAAIAPAAVRIEECVKRLGLRPEHRQLLLIGSWTYEVSGASGNHDWGGSCRLRIDGNEIKMEGRREWEAQNGKKHPLRGHFWETRWATLSQGNKLRLEIAINLKTGPARSFCALTVGESFDRMEGEFFYYAPHAENGTVTFSRKDNSSKPNDSG